MISKKILVRLNNPTETGESFHLLLFFSCWQFGRPSPNEQSGKDSTLRNPGQCCMQPSAHNVPQTEGKPGAGSARRPFRAALGSVVTFSVGSALCHGEEETWKERAHEELKDPAKGRKREISAPGKGNTLLCVCSQNSSLRKGSFHSLLRKNFPEN